jgi:hypothetical protein
VDTIANKLKLGSSPSETGLRLDALATISWLNKKNGKFYIDEQKKVVGMKS